MIFHVFSNSSIIPNKNSNFEKQPQHQIPSKYDMYSIAKQRNFPLCGEEKSYCQWVPNTTNLLILIKFNIKNHINHHKSHAIPSQRSIISTRPMQFVILIKQKAKFESMNSPIAQITKPNTRFLTLRYNQRGHRRSWPLSEVKKGKQI